MSFPSLSSPVWSFSWSLSAATTGSPSRPGDPPETPCRRRGSNESDSNLKQHSHHISYHINSIQVLEQCTYVSPLRNAWKTLSTSSGCMDQIAPPPLLGDRCILGDLPPAPALERMELRTEDDLKTGTSTKTEWDSFLLISSKNKERDDDDDAQGSPSSLLKETVDCWEETGSKRRKKSEILWSILWVFVSTHTHDSTVFFTDWSSALIKPTSSVIMHLGYKSGFHGVWNLSSPVSVCGVFMSCF